MDMNTDDLERVNEWNQPEALGQMRELSGGVLSPRSERMIALQTKGSDPKRRDYEQASDRFKTRKPLV